MKKILFSLIASAITLSSFAQLTKVDEVYEGQKFATTNPDTIAWVKNATFNMGGNQTFLHNWAAGGELSSLVLNGRFDANASL